MQSCFTLGWLQMIFCTNGSYACFMMMLMVNTRTPYFNRNMGTTQENSATTVYMALA
jgi:hypothetical protein